MEHDVTVENLIGSEQVLGLAQMRGNVPTNHAIDQNLTRVKGALKSFRKAQRQEPMKWFFWDQLEEAQDPAVAAPKPAKAKSKEKAKKAKGEAPGKPSAEQRAKGEKAFKEWLADRVPFNPYRLDVFRCSGELKGLSPARETLNADELARLNEDFWVTLKVLNILKEDDQ